jgi:hypothetical protein
MLPAFRTEFWRELGKDDVGGFTANRPQQSVKLCTGHIRAACDNKNVSKRPSTAGKAASWPIGLAKVGQIFQCFGPMKTKTPLITNSMNRLFRHCEPVAALLITLVLACFAPTARAVDPSPDGGYPNQNTAEGEDALFSLTAGIGNTAMGFNALYNNTDGGPNTAYGFRALYSNITGSENVAIGYNALANNMTGGSNTAVGLAALSLNTTGGNNVAVGVLALNRNTQGTENTAIGRGAMENNTTGSLNIAIGPGALQGATPGNQNIAVGWNAGSNLTNDNKIVIGNPGQSGESQTIRIGEPPVHNATFIAGISRTPLASGVAVVIKDNGKLGITVSSERFKDEIKPMDKASEAILALKPVTFRYKKEVDPDGIPHFGLVAEDVEKVNPDLVARDADGKPYTVRYEAVNTMLLNEFLKEHRKVQEINSTVTTQQAAITDLRSTIAQQQRQMEVLTAQLKEQAVQIQKVSNQLELDKAGPRLVASGQ